MMARAELIEDGEWTEIGSSLKHQCCDCGCRHDVKFRANSRGKLEAKFTRNDRATATARRPLKRKVLIVDE